jgi:hypothetical protein
MEHLKSDCYVKITGRQEGVEETCDQIIKGKTRRKEGQEGGQVQVIIWSLGHLIISLNNQMIK